MISRPLYIDKIMNYTDTPFVKVLTGVRRCGKSTILKMIMEKLQKERNIPKDRIVSMRFDSMEYEDMTAKEMFAAIKEKIDPEGRTYFFLDEVQEIEGWEKAVNSLATDYDVDLYVTGSNLKAEHRTIDNETVYSYLEKLEKAYLLHRCSRYDLLGKEILKTQEKFYLADTALRYSVLGYNPDSVAASLENVVYLELCRRGYTVYIGKASGGEVDFAAQRQGEKLYVQVTQEIGSEKTKRREYDRLLAIRDNYPKYVLWADEFAGGNYEGIKSMHVADFLLSKEY